ncbi:hypothetical protein GF354_00235 [Candidatus Peregrinibacteria bacterium]|nr:hypothetical protein [Candidatus Peregrinibacteria bacterium]
MKKFEFIKDNFSPEFLRMSYLALIMTALSACGSDSPEIFENQADVTGSIEDIIDTVPEEAEEVFDIDREKMAQNSIGAAIQHIDENMDVDFDLKESDYYLALAMKESSLKHDAVSSSNALGYFQLKKGALIDVNERFDLNFVLSDIFDEDASSLGRIREVAKNNSIAGILYWYLCRDMYGAKLSEDLNERDKDRLAGFVYKMGPTAVKGLWEDLGNPDNFNDFALRLAKIIAKASDDIELVPSGSELKKDPTYKIDYLAYLRVKGGVDKKVDIGGNNYDVANLIQTLRYTELIVSMHSGPSEPVVENLIPMDTEFIQPDRYLWSIASDLIQNFEKAHSITFPGSSKTKKVHKMIELINQFNIDQGNAVFDGVKPNDYAPNLAVGDKILTPDSEYILSHIEAAASSSKLEVLPEGIPMYSGPNAKELEEKGKKVPVFKGKAPEVVIPEYDGTKIDTSVLTGKSGTYGEMASEDVKYIILHATVGLQVKDGKCEGKLFRTQRMHYLVAKDGTIYRLRDENIAVDHAGLMTEAKLKAKRYTSYAKWNGDAEVSLHSIGIEIETDHTSPGKVDPITEDQYAALKKLVPWIASRFKIPASQVLGHDQIAMDKYGTMGRKPDPCQLDSTKIGLPDNSRRIIPDVASGEIGGDYKEIKRDYQKKGTGSYGCPVERLEGWKASEKIAEEMEKLD